MLLDLFANDTLSLIKSVSVADYKVSLQSDQGSAYLDNNEEKNENKLNNNADTFKG